MSTTIKRVALVAVASLGLGVIGAGSSVAAPTFAYTTIGDSTAGQAIIGGQAVVTLTPDTATITNVAISGVGSVVQAVNSASVTTVGTPSTGAWSDSVTTVAGTQAITLTSSVAGVTTITATPLLADGSPGTAVTKTVTWVSALAKNSVDHSIVYVQSTTGTSVTADTIETADSKTADLTFAAAFDAATEKAVIWVKQYSSNDTTTVSTLAAGKGSDVKVEITGAGSVGNTTSATGSVVSTLGTSTEENKAKLFYVYSDGRTGPATLTITVGTKVVTKTINFTGTTKSYAVNADAPLSKKQVGVNETATISFDGLDVNGIIAEKAKDNLTITNETATVATMARTAAGVYTITGVAVGTARFKVSDGTYSTYVSIDVTGKTAKTVAVAFDKSAYAAGEKVTWTVTAKDATGKPVADGARAVFATVSANLSVIGDLIPTSPSFVDGVATGSFYAPAAASGKFDLSVKQGAADDAVVAGGTAATTVYSFDIVNASADAATEAANDAAQAASDATDAALAAADAADAATTKAQEAVDAVATLSAEVTKLITALKAQITTLSNLVTKIAKKVKA